MSIFINVGGAWKEVKAPSMVVNGARRNPHTGYVNVKGVWKKVFSDVPVNPPIINAITGSTTVDNGSTTEYFISVSAPHIYYVVWEAIGGEVIESSNTHCSIKWNTVGAGLVSAVATDEITGLSASGKLDVQVEGFVPSSKRWTPNWTGETNNVYISFRKWYESNGVGKIEFYYEPHTADMFLFDNESSSSFSRSYFGISAAGKCAFKVDSCTLDGKPLASGDTIPAGYHILEFTTTRTNNIARIGAKYNGQFPWRGQIYSLSLLNDSDPNDPTNIEYNLIEEGDTMPTTTTIVNLAGSDLYEGTLRPDNPAWVEVIDKPVPPPVGLTVGGAVEHEGRNHIGYIKGVTGSINPEVYDTTDGTEAFEITQVSFVAGYGTMLAVTKTKGAVTGTEYLIEISIPSGGRIVSSVFDNDTTAFRVSSRDLLGLEAEVGKTVNIQVSLEVFFKQ